MSHKISSLFFILFELFYTACLSATFWFVAHLQCVLYTKDCLCLFNVFILCLCFDLFFVTSKNCIIPTELYNKIKKGLVTQIRSISFNSTQCLLPFIRGTYYSIVYREIYYAVGVAVTCADRDDKDKFTHN